VLIDVAQFTAPDLASIAQSFDAMEQDTLGQESHHEDSVNMDDTGMQNPCRLVCTLSHGFVPRILLSAGHG
jgi:hypothetical protein